MKNTITETAQAENPASETIRVVDLVPHRDYTPEQVPTETPQPKHGRGCLHKVWTQNQVFIQETDVLEIFLSSKEQADAMLAVQLWAEGKIKTPGMPFEESTQQEIDALITRCVFKFIWLDE